MERKDFLKQTMAACGLAMIPAGILVSCGKQNNTAATNVNFTLDLTNNTYSSLNTVGGWLVANGVIIIRSSASTFNAYSANCTDAGCTVNYDPATVTIYCPCHGGSFSSVTGGVLSGPPPAPLPRYTATLAGNSLTVKS